MKCEKCGTYNHYSLNVCRECGYKMKEFEQGVNSIRCRVCAHKLDFIEMLCWFICPNCHKKYTDFELGLKIDMH